MPAKDPAAYMRDYRKRQRRETVMNTTMPAQAVRDLIESQDRVRALGDEVRQLKRELVKRQPPDFVSGPVVVTSSERVLEDTTLDHLRRNRQRTIDATLAKVNKGKKP